MAQRYLSLSKSPLPAVPAAPAFTLASAPIVSADERLQFTGTTVSGASFDGASLHGKPVVVFSWASWCPFTEQELSDRLAILAT